MIALLTLNARYIHSAFGLRYLAANLRAADLGLDAQIHEFTTNSAPEEVIEALAAHGPPRIIGLGVYIWNASATAALLPRLRAAFPDASLVLGGPEVSHELESQAWTAEADYIVQGEGDAAFVHLCARIAKGQRPLTRVIAGGQPELAQLASPYPLYTDKDLAHRILYVEASRGCPYRCEFCLSSLDKKVRAFDLEALLDDFEDLLARGAKHFKFVDRTFNLDLARSRAILEFFLARFVPGMFLHFEMVPDRFPLELRDLVRQFPAGALQFEVGIQSFDPEVGRRIQRRQNIERTLENLRFLVEETGVHVHADLIAGLPGEGLESFAAGFDRLVATGVHEIQVGILKRLRGTPIARHSEDFEMVFDAAPPYTIRSTRDLDAPTMVRIEAFARVWELYRNRGHFPSSMPRLLAGPSPFAAVMAFADWHLAQTGRLHGLSLNDRARLLMRFLHEQRGVPLPELRAEIEADLVATGHKPPRDLREGPRKGAMPDAPSGPDIPARQARHLRARRELEVGPDAKPNDSTA